MAPAEGARPDVHADDEIHLRRIGTIGTPFTSVDGMPIQPAGAAGLTGEIRIEPEYVAGLRDLRGFSHLILIYHLHRITGFSLEVQPFLDRSSHGIFATRSPARPNPIGISVVRLLSIEGAVLRFANPDMLDGTPLLDIKPYVADFDRVDPEAEGWFEGKSRRAAVQRSDTRFAP
ncbi:MAG TPA: tRNA (N6-threonylcarbamoyladenosine(37)-N6)-methyltransferase TrmO [Rectinemataceae bacterium]|nr:tRNA (N6-threonylcarbamoyladenosine(37)-N6)-methyltransferase TrmO [Rectinemataceae bacterium]